MNKLKMGIIGAGGIAVSRHIPAYLLLKDKVNIVAVQDVNIERAHKIAREYDIPNVYHDYRDLFKEVDAVTICTPNKFHAEITIAALEAGCHVLCEKPMGLNTSECEKMIEAAKKSKRLLGIGYHYRFMPEGQLAKQAIHEIGDPLVTRVQALRRRKVPGWGVFTNKDLQGGGSLIDFGCHLIDLSLWLLGETEPVEVIGKTYNRLSKTPNQINDWGTFDHESFDVDDHVSAYVTFTNGSTMLFECSWAANIKEDTTHLSISGSEAGISVFPYELYTPKYGAFMTTTASIEEDKSGFLQAKNFVESCLGETDLIVKPEESLRVTKIIDAIYESSQSGKSVRF
ncbi:Gfo/Idh/MocA family protein [Oceanobacillus sp. Castelsardo]|uniref:Gfo/Idh/MocA family protein n=1 Tax=Oceanobacillus sp. Castelsardo TaxID=1851204 RepID=UPI0008388414|nr:Gfo/Idh/MocA family oxidoreductase [Oceanobacillus sp. Castelsardo]